MKPKTLLAALALCALAGVAQAQAQQPTPPKLDENTLLFCKDDTGQLRQMKFATLGTVVRRYANRFAFALTVQQKPMVLMFSDPKDSPYFISYQAQPYDDGEGHSGIALTSMHLFLDNADRDITGTPMCFFTEFGK